MGIIISAIKIIFVFAFLIIIHEGGHFIVAKICKVKVNEFSIGFGKELFSKNKNGTKYTLRLVPLGGYVNLLGEENKVNEESSYTNAPMYKKFAILFAGAIINILFAIIVFFILVSIINNSLEAGFLLTKNYVSNMFSSVIALFSGNKGNAEVVGPVGISSIIANTNSVMEFVYMMSMISFSLGITNLLPVPGLDGGKIFILLIELIRRKPLKEETEANLTLTGLVILMTIAILITVKDIVKIF